MNANRRKAIQTCIDQLEALQNEIENHMSDEQEYYDNMPESFQNGEKGETAQNAIDNLESTIDSIRESLEHLNESIS